MPIISRTDRDQRIAELPRPLRKLCTKSIDDPNFILVFRCRVHDLIVYDEEGAGFEVPSPWDGPEQPDIVPLWECDHTLTAQRGLAFVEFDYEDPEDLVRISRTATGLLMYLFHHLLEDAGGRAEQIRAVREVARALDFERTEEMVKLQPTLSGDSNATERLLAYIEQHE